MRSFNTQLIWQLCKPEPNMPTLDLAFFFFFLIWSRSPSCVWLLFNCFLSARSIISPGPFVGGGVGSGVYWLTIAAFFNRQWLNNRNLSTMMRSLIGVWFDNIWLNVPAHNHTHVDLRSDSWWLLGISFLGLFNEKKGGDGRQRQSYSLIHYWFWVRCTPV